jgi:hypothetical protein
MFTVGINDGGQMYYPQVGTTNLFINFSISAKNFKSYTNSIAIKLSITPTNFNNSFSINKPAIDDTTINYDEVIYEQLTLDTTGLNADTLDFHKE